jgi:uncharacterized protein
MKKFENVVTTEQELRDIVGIPIPRVLQKERPFVDAHCRAFIERSPFLLMATSDLNGRCDVSPKGDAPGFVRVLNERQLAIPDRPGNKRLDGMTNLIVNPQVGLIFLVPGRNETLRINGHACITRDPGLLRQFDVQGKVPQLAIVVDVEQCFLHCGKAFLRAKLWTHEQWPAPDALPSMACILFDQLKPEGMTLQQLDDDIQEGYRTRLY